MERWSRVSMVNCIRLYCVYILYTLGASREFWGSPQKSKAKPSAGDAKDAGKAKVWQIFDLSAQKHLQDSRAVECRMVDFAATGSADGLPLEGGDGSSPGWASAVSGRAPVDTTETI